MKNDLLQSQEKTKAALLRISASVESAPYVLMSEGQPEILVAASCITDFEVPGPRNAGPVVSTK